MTGAAFKQHLGLARSHFTAADGFNEEGIHTPFTRLLYSVRSILDALETLTPEQPPAAEPEAEIEFESEALSMQDECERRYGDMLQTEAERICRKSGRKTVTANDIRKAANSLYHTPQQQTTGATT